MKKAIIMVLALIFLSCAACKSSIDSSQVKQDLQYLCSEECFGRLPGSPGNTLAQDYILSHFKSAGLMPLDGADGLFIPYQQKIFDAQARSQTLIVESADGTIREFYSGQDFYPYLYPTTEFEGAVSSTKNGVIQLSCKAGNVEFVCSDMATARIYDSENKNMSLFRCSPKLFDSISQSSFIRFKGQLQLEVAATNNVVGVLAGKNRSEAIIVSAHFDHVGGYGNIFYPGALDNASGVATLLEIVRSLAESEPAIDIVFVAFNGEDMGQQGSQALASSLPYQKINAINIDVVGMKESSSLMVLGDEPLSQKLVDFWEDSSSLQAYYSKEDAMSDHVSLRQAGIPAVTVSSGVSFDVIAEKTHYPTDTIAGLSIESIAQTAQMIVSYLVAQGQIEILPQIADSVSSEVAVAQEQRFIQAEALLRELVPAADEIVIMESDDALYAVRNVSHFIDVETLQANMPQVKIPSKLGEFSLVKTEPLNSVGRVFHDEQENMLGVDVYMLPNEQEYRPGQVYDLPDNYCKSSYTLMYKNSDGEQLDVLVRCDDKFSAEEYISQYEEVKVILESTGTYTLYYQRYEDNKDYPRGILFEPKGFPGYIVVSKFDLLSHIDEDELLNLIAASAIELGNLPLLY